MWQPLFDGASDEDVPITHVTNGAQSPTFLVGADARRCSTATWATAGSSARGDRANVERRAVDSRRRAVGQLAAPRAPISSPTSAAERRWIGSSAASRSTTPSARHDTLDAGSLTLGFARRLATYKRVNLLVHDPQRAAATAHRQIRPCRSSSQARPIRATTKASELAPEPVRGREGVARGGGACGRCSRTTTSRSAPTLVAGCDVWINLPRRPMEASGTSGMKSAFNGGLQLSVLDGWWAEAYDGKNGWGIEVRGERPGRGRRSRREPLLRPARARGDPALP